MYHAAAASFSSQKTHPCAHLHNFSPSDISTRGGEAVRINVSVEEGVVQDTPRRGISENGLLSFGID